MKDLLIGNTSQLSHYFESSNEIVKISSRDNVSQYSKQEWDSVYLCFGESRKFIKDSYLYKKINQDLTLNYINLFQNQAKKIIVFATCELWNMYSGAIDLTTTMAHWDTEYLQSKRELVETIKQNKYTNVVIVYPFNFNSINRNDNFLFGKIFESIIYKKQIVVGNTYFYRDMISPKFLVDTILKAENDIIVGSGRLTFVNDFIRDIYKNFGLNYESFVKEDLTEYKEYNKNNEYYLKSKKYLYSYDELLKFTLEDIEKKRNSL